MQLLYNMQHEIVIVVNYEIDLIMCMLWYEYIVLKITSSSMDKMTIPHDVEVMKYIM